MKLRACRCCDGSGNELDDVAVGREMRKLREAAKLSLRRLGDRMRPRLKPTYLSNLETGDRNWNLKLVEQYKKVCL